MEATIGATALGRQIVQRLERRCYATLCMIKIMHRLIELTTYDGVPQTRHDTLIMAQIMNRIQSRTKNLTALIQMMQICTAIVLTGVTVTRWINRIGIGSICCVPEFEDTLIGK